MGTRVGPEVKACLPELHVQELERWSSLSGLTRAHLIRTIVTSTLVDGIRVPEVLGLFDRVVDQRGELWLKSGHEWVPAGGMKALGLVSMDGVGLDAATLLRTRGSVLPAMVPPAYAGA